MRLLCEFATGIKEGFQEFGATLATLVNAFLLTIIYFAGVGTTSVIGKICRKRFLELKSSERKSYWIDLNLGKKTLQEYRRQF